MIWRDFFSYDPESGQLYWATNRGTAKKGDAAGSLIGDRRYWNVKLRGKRHYVHRIIWEMHHGPIPKGMCIDHINGDGRDNRIDNLRVATLSENQRNRAVNKNSSTGITGVCRHGNGRGFNVQCAGDYIGYFTDIKEAAAARRRAEISRGYLNDQRKEEQDHANT